MKFRQMRGLRDLRQARLRAEMLLDETDGSGDAREIATVNKRAGVIVHEGHDSQGTATGDPILAPWPRTQRATGLRLLAGRRLRPVSATERPAGDGHTDADGDCEQQRQGEGDHEPAHRDIITSSLGAHRP